jgi:hypothetical protein
MPASFTRHACRVTAADGLTRPTQLLTYHFLRLPSPALPFPPHFLLLTFPDLLRRKQGWTCQMFLRNDRKVTKMMVFHTLGKKGIAMDDLGGNTLQFRWLGVHTMCAYVEKRSGTKVADLGRGT